jgi:hypothetical protein
VLYEAYGAQADRQHIELEQARRNIWFTIKEMGGNTAKVDRIRRLVPVFEGGRIVFPPYRNRTLHDNRTVDLVDVFQQEEYLAFPVGRHDDLLDCLARIVDPDLKSILKFPEGDDGAGGFHKHHVQRPTHYKRGYEHLKTRRDRPRPNRTGEGVWAKDGSWK